MQRQNTKLLGLIVAALALLIVGAGSSFAAITFTIPNADAADGSATAIVPPNFTSELPDTTISEGQTLTFDYDADDADEDEVSFDIDEGPAGASIDGNTGELTWTPDFDAAGVHTFVVRARDGTESTTTTAMVTVENVTANFQTHLSGFHENPSVSTPGAGTVNVELDQTTLIVTGSFGNLTAPVNTAIRGGAHIHVAGSGVNGPIAVEIAPTLATDGRSGTFEAADNTIDLTTVDYPDGMDADAFIDALWNGDTYVNVHTFAYGSGEIRGQVLGVDNQAPEASNVLEPEDGDEFIVEGDSADILVAVHTSEAPDPDGNDVDYIIEASIAPTFPHGFTVNRYFEEAPGGFVTVGEAELLIASLPEVTGGTSIDLFVRVITTDGSRWTAGTPIGVTVSLGTDTAAEDDSELPGEFALRGNYPNPFNPSTTVHFDLPTSAEVRIDVYDILGRRVMTVPAQPVEAGSNRAMEIDAGTLTSGTYVYRVIAESQSSTMVRAGKMALVK